MRENLIDDSSDINISRAAEKEREINAIRNELKRDYLKKIENGDYQVKEAVHYLDLINYCEKAADHVFNVSKGIAGQI